ncbi:site-specific integrase [Bradyrhizobium sp. BRP20]|uniref:tyrosine-type recombinase/integrase n=1 Tax=unclassified Bradyrhizobium TaxID=2631580 RepID=UPI001CD48BB4|nr:MULTISPECIES: site-specific integrase [unclassified Bradyrhizobium]MCA1433456.1 site-specific integrase [Bradyrhizobium sp. BRP20]MCA1469163.1 site-specific integrase [Bradyrhizobium sp. IC3195]MCA1550766.1 site-specific integrase [Bradyrhizobium sp. BRP19]
MPRRSKGARLQLKAARRNKSGKITHQATWIIRDNGRDVSTGCAADEIAAAEEKLRDYISSKHTPKRRIRHIDDIPIADVLSIYMDAQLDKLRGRFKVDSESEDTIPDIRKLKKRIERLNEWWGAKMLGEVNGEACRSYAKKRGKRGGARRDLEDLRAAIGHHTAEGYHREIVKVSLPEKGQPRDKWLTRSDAAKLVWTCWRYNEMQKGSRRPMDDVKVPTSKRPLRHLARFILLGIYSGTRAGAIAAASPIPAIGRSYVDLERGRYYRLKQGSSKTNKRQPTVPIPVRLLAHLRRWHRIDPEAKHFVEYNGRPITSVKTAFKSAVRLAGLGPGISPHTLRHTAATWLMQRGADPWQAAGYLGMSLEVLLNTYGHHHPDYLSDAVEKIAKRDPAGEPKAVVSGAVSGAVIPIRRNGA